MEHPWHLFVDTGGTFTDCFAKDPQQKTHRLKILSSSRLKGKIIARLSATQWKVALDYPLATGVLTDYLFRHPQTGLESPVQAYDTEQGLLQLALPLAEMVPGDDFEILSPEEAPVFAARLLTGTPVSAPLPPLEMRLGSTKGTNALLERKGAKVGLLTTQGLGDLLRIGTQQRPDLFALNVRKAPPLYERVIEVAERIDATGHVLVPLAGLGEETFGDCDAWAIALMNSYQNPRHEQQIGEILQAAGQRHISLSTELAPEIKLLPRAQTTVVNAYLAPVIESYLAGVQEHLGPGKLWVMSSAGGMVHAPFFRPKDSLLSGPAGGVVGAAWAAERAGFSHILTFDMGGTSTDVARYAGQFEYQYQVEIAGVQLLSPTMAIETVAAGGGSICRFDGEKLQVGPESAGAHPGPLTITDVNLLLGHLDPDAFAFPLHPDAARSALTAVRGSACINDLDLLQGFLQIANEKMAAAIRNISVRKGFSPSGHCLLSFGGAGGQHACALADLLEIDQVLIPQDASILSARGMEKAEIERFVSRQILAPFEEVKAALPTWIENLSQAACQQLRAENPDAAPPVIKQLLLSLRLQGQDNSLEVAYQPEIDPLVSFRQAYEQLFGHWIADHEIELVSIRVSAILPGEPDRPPLADPVRSTAPISRQYAGKAVYLWEELPAGAAMSGPALLISPFTTVYIAEKWTASLNAHRDCLLQREEATPQHLVLPEAKNEAIQLELFTHRFSAIAQEMGAQLERTSFSVNVKERLDFSCALLDAAGKLVVNAPHIPVHLGSLGICVRSVMAAIAIGPGDVIITNHPGYGGSHLPDITLIRGVFTPAGERIAFLANRAHHAEIGGTRPGSMPPDATSLAEEGIVIPPMYLVREGVVQWEAIEALLQSGPYPTRALAENIADLKAGLASLHSGHERLLDLVATFGQQEIQFYMNRLQQYTASCLLRNLPQGVFQARETLDDGSPLAVRLTFSPTQIEIDFSGSAAVHPGNLNANEAIVNSVTMYVLRLLLREDIPLNEGLLDPVTLIIPKGMLNPDFSGPPSRCPAVVGGNVETSQRLADTLLKALGLAACSQGTMNNLLFGNEWFGYYETICGGTGAGPGFDGCDAVHQHMTNTRITDPEVLEFRYPVRLERFSIRVGSGGAGKWRGGNGIIREICFLEPVSLTILSQHRVVAPYGLAGGKPGKKGRQWIIRKDGSRVPLLGIDGKEMQKGDTIVLESPGGGGFGPDI